MVKNDLKEMAINIDFNIRPVVNDFHNTLCSLFFCFEVRVWNFPV